MDVRLPDGTIVQNVPDNITKAELVNKLTAAGLGSAFATKEDRQTFDPTSGMSGVQKFNAGMGSAVANMGRGASQMMGGTSEQEVANARKLDQPLMNTGAGLAGNIVGNILPVAATSAIPGVNTYTGAAAIGGLSGALQPTVQGEDRLSNVAIGAGLGGASQGLANAIGRLGKGAKSALNPEEQRLAQVAAQEGIPLTASQQTGSKALKTFDAAFENIPSTSGAQARTMQTQQEAFNKAVLQRAGVTSNQATPDVLAAQKGALGKRFEDIAGRNAVDFNQGLTTELSNIVGQASRRLPPDKAGAVANTVDDILAQVDQKGLMLGTNYQGWRSELGRLAKGNDTEAHYFSEVKKAIDKAFTGQISGADASAWKEISGQYGNLKTVMGAMGGSGMAPNAGNISPAQLAQALAGSVGREGKALGRGELNDLSRVGNTFLRPQVPDSGTARRLLAQGLLTGGGGYLATQDPKQALIAGAVGMGLPAAARAAMYSPAAQQLMTQGVPRIANNEALIRALLRGGASAAPAVLNAP